MEKEICRMNPSDFEKDEVKKRFKSALEFLEVMHLRIADARKQINSMRESVVTNFWWRESFHMDAETLMMKRSLTKEGQNHQTMFEYFEGWKEIMLRKSTQMEKIAPKKK